MNLGASIGGRIIRTGRGRAVTSGLVARLI
jgi:hypothetical protein